jgi:hypothetical protein
MIELASNFNDSLSRYPFIFRYFPWLTHFRSWESELLTSIPFAWPKAVRTSIDWTRQSSYAACLLGLFCSEVFVLATKSMPMDVCYLFQEAKSLVAAGKFTLGLSRLFGSDAKLSCINSLVFNVAPSQGELALWTTFAF